jgi:hypothetical protein
MRRGMFGLGCALTLLAGRAGAQNLLVNPGFETGDLTGYLVGGTNAATVFVGSDGTLIPGTGPILTPAFINVHSGSFAAGGLVRCSGSCTPPENFTLTQTVAVLPGTSYSVGFWLGNDSPSAFGADLGDPTLQIFANGVGLLSSDFMVVTAGSASGDMHLISTSFNSGAASSVTLTFQISGSGTQAADASVDDLFLVGPAAVVPEPATVGLLAAGLAVLGFAARRRGARPS